jgi:hypothetical protein
LLGRFNVAKAVEHGELALQKRIPQALLTRLHHRRDGERLRVGRRLEGAQHLEALRGKALGKVAADVARDRLDEDLALWLGNLVLIVCHACCRN